MNELKKEIMLMLANKGGALENTEKYEYVQNRLNEEFYFRVPKEDSLLEGVCLYIEACIQRQCVASGIPMTQDVINGFMTPEYCLNRAYEYLQIQEQQNVKMAR